MNAPSNPHHSDQEALLRAIDSVLAPLAQLCVARGMPVQPVEAHLRRLYVQAAWQAHVDSGTTPNTSRVSAATGLTRREVTRHLQSDAAPVDARPSPTTQVFSRWLTDPALRDAHQNPMSIPRQGASPSFESLAHSVTQDVHPRTLLDELCRLNLVSLDAGTDTVRLSAGAFVPRADWSRMVGFLGQNVGDHFRAATANVLGDGQQHFEQAIHADELSEASMAQVRQLVSHEWKRLQDTLVPAITALIEEDRQAQRATDQQVRIGFFTWSQPMLTSPVTPHEGVQDDPQ